MALAPTKAATEHLIDSSQEQPSQPSPPTAHNLSFPPFPHLQNNAPLIPFTEFVPKGTQIKGADEGEDETQDGARAVEVDGEGVPTVMLAVTHDLDKTNKKKTKSSARSGARASKIRADGTSKPWFEQWADNEFAMRAERLDPAQFTAHEILIQADIDFQHRRFFPLSVRALYDEFRVFLGIIDRIEKRHPFVRQPEELNAPLSTPGAAQQPSAPVGDEADEEYLDDIDDDDMAIPASRILNTGADPIPSFSIPTTTNNDNHVEQDEDYSGPLQPIQERSQFPALARCEQFLANPALAVKCFLSHEFRNRGLYWLEFNLHAGPIIVSAFLDFIIRHQLLPTSDYGEPLKEAAQVAHRAREELPKTKKASLVLRDGWGTVCVGIWGSREQLQWGIQGFSWSPSKADDEGYMTELSDAPVATLIEENDHPVPETTPKATVVAVPNNKPSKDSLKAPTTVVGDAPVLGAGTGGWEWHSTSSTDIHAEGENASAPLAADDIRHGWGSCEDENEYNAGSPTWDAVSPSMFTYVGCASFPLTHSPVRAERSVREILAIHPPMNIFASTHANPISLLHSKLATVILGPWRSGGDARNYKEGGEIPPPVMLPMCSSERDRKDKVEEEYPAQFFHTGEVGSTHDAFKDLITVFIDPEITGSLTVGLGIGGTFVQVARKLDAPIFPAIKDGNALHRAHYQSQGKNPNKSTPPYKPNDGRSWWYIDNVSQVIPSYWTDIEDLPLADI